MKIKQLELKGFKSFRSRTRVRFEEGVSCIVGPNGCGKSNVVDAFLWVMGESAPRQLRGKAMEDLIFAGTGQQPEAGWAEVSLTLEQTKKGKTLDLKKYNLKSKEIMITRRLDRDGLSEYLINSQTARLKDVQEIFMDTGAGRHGFSFIEQGAVENFISSHPEQKKLMVESVAGISRFRFRKKEAERKLELTKNNLNRLEDILTQQESQLKKLKRQSKTAQKFKDLKKQIRKTEHEITVWDLMQIQKQQNQISKEIQTETKKQSHILAEQEKAKKQVLALNEALKTLRETKVKREGEREELKTQLIPLEKEIAGQKMALQLSKKSLSDTTLNLNYQKKQMSSLKAYETQIQQGEQKQNQLKEMWFSLKTEEENLNTKLSHILMQKEAISHQIKGKEQEEALLRQKESAIKKAFQEEEEKSALSQSQLRQKEEEIQKLLFRQNSLKEEGEKRKQMSFNMSHLLEKEKEELNILKKDIEALVQNLKEVKEEETSVYSEWQSLKKREALLKEEDKTKIFILKSQAEGFLDTAQSLKLSSPFLERALASYLEPRLNSLFCFKEERGLKALDTLNQTKQGSCRFVLPLKEEEKMSAMRTAEALKKEAGFQFLLKDQVEGEKTLVESLFSKTAVVSDLPTALQLKNRYPNWCFITLTGEVISQEGDLIAVSDKTQSLVLSWEKALEALPLKYEKAKKRRLSLEKIIQEKENQLETRINKMSALNHKEHSFEMQTLEIKKDLEVLSLNHNRVQKEKSHLHAEQTEIQNKKRALMEESQLLQTEIDELESEKNRLQKIQKELAEKNLQKEQEKQEFSKRKEQLWQNLLFFEKEQTIREEQKKFLEQEQEKEQKESIQRSSQLQKQKARIQISETLLFQKEEKKSHMEKQISKMSEEINQLKEEEKKQEIHREKTQEELMLSHEALTESESALNSFKLKQESLFLKKSALMETPDSENSQLLKKPAKNLTHFNREKENEKWQALKNQLSRMGEVNLLALREYEELLKEHNFYQKQYEDLKISREKLSQVINRIDLFCSKKFKEVFEEVRSRFSKLWPALFEGGKANLILTQDSKGLDVMVQPPGKKIQNMNLLSGGEKAMTALAMMFSLFLTKPSPFCILDEVDAPLDDNNVTRFNALLSEMARLSQIILITHNKQSMKSATALYGVTMEEKGVSKIMSLKMPTRQENIRNKTLQNLS